MSWALGLIVFHVNTGLESRSAKLGLHGLGIFGPADADRSCRTSRYSTGSITVIPRFARCCMTQDLQ
jgi:hypothetical protein